MAQTIRLLIVHDDHLHRQCLAMALDSTARFAPIDVAGGAAEALHRVRTAAPEVMLVNWDLPGHAAPDLVRHIVGEFPAVKALMLGVAEALDNIGECAAAGCTNYVPKHATLEELIARIENGARGDPVRLPAATLARFPRPAVLNDRGQANGEVRRAQLTPRELQILELIAAGLSNKEIARSLCVSLHTVKNHVHNLLDKLAVTGRYAAAQYVGGWHGPAP